MTSYSLFQREEYSSKSSIHFLNLVYTNVASNIAFSSSTWRTDVSIPSIEVIFNLLHASSIGFPLLTVHLALRSSKYSIISSLSAFLTLSFISLLQGRLASRIDIS